MLTSSRRPKEGQATWFDTPASPRCLKSRLVHMSCEILCRMAHYRNRGRSGLATRRPNLWGQNHLIRLKMQVMASLAPVNKSRAFNPNTFLATIGEGRKNLTFVKKQGIFAQGDTADSVFYIQKGKVKLTVVSKTGREATIGLLGAENFF